MLSVFDRDLIMCECGVYFETYRHVYSVLKSLTDETFPMKNYIVDVDVSHYYLHEQHNNRLEDINFSLFVLHSLPHMNRLHPIIHLIYQLKEKSFSPINNMY